MQTTKTIHPDNKNAAKKRKPRTVAALGLPEATIEKRLASIPVRYKNSYRRVWDGKGGRPLAVKLQCLDCCGMERLAIQQCGDRLCPLWSFRPYQKKEAQ